VTPLYPQKLALTSPTGGGRSVGIVRSRTKAMEYMVECKRKKNEYRDSRGPNYLVEYFIFFTVLFRLDHKFIPNIRKKLDDYIMKIATKLKTTNRY
jgi:hypothetical protein